MKKLNLIILAVVAVIVIFMASTLVSPILIVCEDMGEDGSIDMAATYLIGFTLEVHLIHKDRPFIMSILTIPKIRTGLPET